MVKSVNGVKVKNAKHVMELIENAKTDHVRVDCLENGPIVLRKDLAEAANKEIMRTHSVFSLKSRDLGGELPGDDAKEEPEPEVDFESLFGDLETLHTEGEKVLEKMGIPKNTSAANVAADAAGGEGIVGFLAKMRGTLNKYKDFMEEVRGENV